MAFHFRVRYSQSTDGERHALKHTAPVECYCALVCILGLPLNCFVWSIASYDKKHMSNPQTVYAPHVLYTTPVEYLVSIRQRGSLELLFDRD